MRKLKLILVALCVITSTTSTTAQQQEPFEIMQTAVLHGLSISYTHDYSMYMRSQYGNSEFSNQEARRIVEAGRKKNIRITYADRGNMMEYYLYFLDTLTVRYHAWFREEESEGPLITAYKFGRYRSGSDPWMHQRFPRTSNDPPYHDSDESFQLHALFVALLIQADLNVPQDISIRLIDNMNTDRHKIQCFKEILTSRGLEFVETTEALRISNIDCTRTYTLMKIRGKQFASIFKIWPKW